MKIKSYFFALLAGLSACHNYRNISFPVGKSDLRLSMNIPKGYDFQGLVTEHGDEDRYWYSDSSVIYITNFPNTLNYSEIQKQSTYSKMFLAEQQLDTLCLSGKDDFGLYWKDRVLIITMKNEKIGYRIVGYSKVPPQHKAKFEEAISSIRMDKPRRTIKLN
jgi:hypothetical protein